MWLEIDAEIDVHPCHHDVAFISLVPPTSPSKRTTKTLEQQIAMAAEDNFDDVPSGEEEEEETTLKSR